MNTSSLSRESPPAERFLFLEKPRERNFRILNLTDPQLADDEWENGRQESRILTGTVDRLVAQTAPDLITVSGDLAWAGHFASYRRLSALLDGYGVPWAPVFGNHDAQGGREALAQAAAILCAGGRCLLQEGDPSLGYGNYILIIAEEGRPLHALILMDSHDRREYIGENGEKRREWADLTPEQAAWYRAQIEELKALGVRESTIVMHIPLYTYREAAKAAYRAALNLKAIPPGEGMQTGCFNEGYEDSFGVAYEGICSYPADNRFFDGILAGGHTKTVLCGHDHVNSFSIPYRGVRLIYALKTGPGCYYDERLNGGTLLTVDGDGRLTAKHIFVDPRSV